MNAIDDKFTRDMVLNPNTWSGEMLCMKKRPKAGEPVGVMGYSTFGVITAARLPIVIYLRENFVETMTYNSLDELIADGWIVD
jgi:hypothetical protein